MLPNLSHLQIELTPKMYEALWPKDKPLGESIFMPDAYWQSLPRYLIARCPICSEDYQENLDTYTLFKWVRAESGENAFREKHGDPSRCEHFVRVQSFIHLNQTRPEEVRRFWECDQIPNVMLPFLPDEIESYGVMHALPICRIEADQFVPRYTLYLITYYSAVENVEPLLNRARQQCGWGLVCIPPDIPNVDPLWWDLNYWVRAERLHWLSLDHPQLTLQKGPPEAFPYGDIKGPRKRYVHR